ncbi:Peptidase family M60 domain containing protein [Cryptosporidium felis]|nr:Peptidase family M60 domain containing protein [Cryptosporidium felis]
MEISPRIWFFVLNSGNESEEFCITVRKRASNGDLLENDICIYSLAEDVIENLFLRISDWKWGEYFRLANQNVNWEETEPIEKIIFKEKDKTLLRVKVANSRPNSKKVLLKFHLINDNHHITDISKINLDDWDPKIYEYSIKYYGGVIRNHLINNLEKIKLIGTPGQLHCFGKQSIGLIGGGSCSKGNFSWCSGITLYGDGTILSFSHEGFLLESHGHKVIKTILNNLLEIKNESKNKLNIGFIGFSEQESLNFVQGVNNGKCNLTRSLFYELLDFKNIKDMVFSGNTDIIVLNGSREKLKSTNEVVNCSNILKEYIYSGKILVIGLCPWGWECINGSGSLKRNSICNEINKEMGMIYTDEYFWGSGEYIEIKNEKSLLSTYFYWEKLTHSLEYPNDKSLEFGLDEYFLMAKDIENHLNCINKTSEQQRIVRFIAEFLKKEPYLELNPPFNMQSGIIILIMSITTTRMNEDCSEKLEIEGESEYFFNNFDNWISENQFWRDNLLFLDKCQSELNVQETNLLVDEHFCSVFNCPLEWQNTGIYLRYKSKIKVDFISNVDFNSNHFQVKLRIGCHSDYLRFKEIDILNRVPVISKVYNWNLEDSKSIVIESPCDGIVYFEFICSIKTGNLSKIDLEKQQEIGLLKFETLNELKLTLTPIYSIDDHQISKNSDGRIIVSDLNKWKKLFSNSIGNYRSQLPYWLELHGKKVVLTLPIKVFFQNYGIAIDELLEFWDSVVSIQDDLFKNDKWSKERIVCDIQISDGYMHSGYPIMVHLDMVEDYLYKGGLLDLKTIKNEGNWGIYHELGHNRQSNYWTFNGTEEVTVNLFTMYTYYKLHPNKYPLNIDYVRDQLEIGIEYLIELRTNLESSKKTEDMFRNRWINNHGIAFCNYFILIVIFGWDTFKTIFRVYETISKMECNIFENQDDVAKMATWIIVFSSVVGIDMKNFFIEWGWWFCMEPAKSKIDIQALCVELQRCLLKIGNMICVNESSKKDNISSYEDLVLVNGWNTFNLNSLELLLDFQGNSNYS